MTYTPPGVESRRAGTPAPAPKTSGLAIASLVLGIVGPCTVGLGSIIGIILGIVGLVKIGKSAGAKGGQGLAIAGIVVSGLGIVLLPVLLGMLGMLAGILMPAMFSARDMAYLEASQNNVKQLCKAVHMYANVNGDKLPPEGEWPRIFGPTVGGDKLVDPSDPGGALAYAMNARLNGTIRHADSARVVLFFERTYAPGPMDGGPELLPDKPRHAGRYVIGFLDGHVERVAPEEVRRLIWQPKREPGF
jgi:prepilin-type processing-associated H-X9-DG protein